MTSDTLGEAVHREHECLVMGAIDKADSVVQLTDGLSIQSVLDIGSGTGAVLNRLDELGFGERYTAIEPSTSLLEMMLTQARPSRLVDADATTFGESRFRSDRFDLAVLSHVLEHVEDPAVLLAQVLEVADYVLVEVPLDGMPVGNVRAAVKTRLRHQPRINNAAGHVQFFSRHDVRQLIHWCGGEVVRDRLYSPAVYDPDIDLLPRATRTYRWMTATCRRVVGPSVWARLYHGHYATLIQRRPAISISDRSQWAPTYFYDAN